MSIKKLTKTRDYENITKKIICVTTAAAVVTAGAALGGTLHHHFNHVQDTVHEEIQEEQVSAVIDYPALLSDYLADSVDPSLSLLYEETTLMGSVKDRTTVFLSQDQIKRASISGMVDSVAAEASRTSGYLKEADEIGQAVDELLTEIEVSMMSLDSMLSDSQEANENLRRIENSKKAVGEARSGAEAAARKGEEAKKASASLSHRSSFGSVSDDDYNCLLRIVEAEAGNQGMIGKILVANVILNRVESGNFPNGIQSVVFQSNQFSPIDDGRYYTVDVTSETVEAVNRALNGEDYSSGALYFTAFYDESSWFARDLTLLFREGGHWFYR